MHDISVSALFRDEIEPAHSRLRWRYRVLTAAAAIALLVSIVVTSPDRRLALIYLGRRGWCEGQGLDDGGDPRRPPRVGLP